MNGVEFIKRFREETMDGVTPYLWSDALVLRYLNEAQTEFCRETEGIEDSVSSACRVEAVEGEAVIRLNPKIQKIRAAMLETVSRELDICSVEEARSRGIGLNNTRRGVPHTLVTGIGRHMAQLVPTPTSAVALRMDVFRLPLCGVESKLDETEVDDKHAQALMHYALFRAYSRPDPDTMDRVRADYFAQQFTMDCVAAKREQGRARKPNGVTQFSW